MADSPPSAGLCETLEDIAKSWSAFMEVEADGTAAWQEARELITHRQYDLLAPVSWRYN